jgi:hypothetical protein
MYSGIFTTGWHPLLHLILVWHIMRVSDVFNAFTEQAACSVMHCGCMQQILISTDLLGY